MIGKYRRRKKLKRLNFGREGNWDVQLNTVKIAELINPLFADMFWYCYKINIINHSFEEDFLTNSFWDRNDLKFFSRELQEYCKRDPIFSFPDIDNPQKILVRGLSIEP